MGPAAAVIRGPRGARGLLDSCEIAPAEISNNATVCPRLIGTGRQARNPIRIPVFRLKISIDKPRTRSPCCRALQSAKPPRYRASQMKPRVLYDAKGA